MKEKSKSHSKVLIIGFIVMLLLVAIGTIIIINYKGDSTKLENNYNQNKVTDEVSKSTSKNNENKEVETTGNIISSEVTSKSKPINSTTSSSTTRKITTKSTKSTKRLTSSTNTAKTTNNVTTKKQDKPWEKFGVTEDEYYNKPIYDWETIDFSVKQYGSEKNAKNACREYGFSYEPYKNGEVSFNCSTVYSLSGNYLGEMFFTEKLR